MAPPRKADRDAARAAYEVGGLTKREIAAKFGVKAVTVRKWATEGGWAYGALAGRVAERAEAELLRDEPNEEVTDAVVNRAAKAGAEVIRSHRAFAERLKGIVGKLADDLEMAIEQRAEIADEIYDATKDDRGAERRNKMLKAVELPTHAVVLRELVGSTEKLIGIERQAHSLDGTKNPRPPTDDMNDDEINARLADLLRKAGIGGSAGGT